MKGYMILMVMMILVLSACSSVIKTDTDKNTVVPQEPIYNNNEQDPEDVEVKEPTPAEKKLPLPVMDMINGEKYKSETGGLYGDGLNIPPEAHRKAALLLASSIEPVDKSGNPSSTGKIGMIALGYDNTESTFDVFTQNSESDMSVNKDIIFVNGGQAGKDSYAWSTAPEVMAALRKNVETAGLTNKQVQVAWIMMTNNKPINEFPYEADKHQKYLYNIILKLKNDYPNIKMVYFSSDIYRGYSTVEVAEPYAYEYAFAIKWLIKSQISGSKDLNYDSNKGIIRAPIMLWGPYLWANGDNARSDDLTWETTDYEADGVTLTNSGKAKTARMLTDFFKNNELTKGWFLAEN